MSEISGLQNRMKVYRKLAASKGFIFGSFVVLILVLSLLVNFIPCISLHHTEIANHRKKLAYHVQSNQVYEVGWPMSARWEEHGRNISPGDVAGLVTVNLLCLTAMLPTTYFLVFRYRESGKPLLIFGMQILCCSIFFVAASIFDYSDTYIIWQTSESRNQITKPIAEFYTEYGVKDFRWSDHRAVGLSGWLVFASHIIFKSLAISCVLFLFNYKIIYQSAQQSPYCYRRFLLSLSTTFLVLILIGCFRGTMSFI